MNIRYVSPVRTTVNYVVEKNTGLHYDNKKGKSPVPAGTGMFIESEIKLSLV